MKPVFVLLFAGVALLGATGGVAAADGQHAPPWPGNETNSTTVPPGQQLAGAVGAQGASVEGELWNHTLTDRLDNATTPAERAEVIANETETIEEYVAVLEGVRANVTEAWEDDEIGEGEYRATLSAFAVRAHTVELRANETAQAAENLSVIVRDARDVNVTHVRDLSDRAAELYRFEDDLAQEVVNGTLTNETALAGMPVEADASNRTAPVGTGSA